MTINSQVSQTELDSGLCPVNWTVDSVQCSPFHFILTSVMWVSYHQEFQQIIIRNVQDNTHNSIYQYMNTQSDKIIICCVRLKFHMFNLLYNLQNQRSLSLSQLTLDCILSSHCLCPSLSCPIVHLWLVLHCHVMHCHALHFHPLMSCPALSSSTLSSENIRSCIVMPCTLVCHCHVCHWLFLHFQHYPQ